MRRRLAGVVLAVALGVGIGPPGAVATPTPADGVGAATDRPKLFVVGDSVMLGAADAMASAFPEWDVHVAGVPAIWTDVAAELAYEQREHVGDVAVVATGYNYPYWDPPRFDRMIERMILRLHEAGARHIIWLTLREPTEATTPRSGWWQISTYAFYFHAVNGHLARAAARHPDLTLADWTAVSDVAGITYDAVHVNDDGARRMASLVRAAVDGVGALAANPPVRRALLDGRADDRVVTGPLPAGNACAGFASWDDADDRFWSLVAARIDTTPLDPDVDLVPCEDLPGAPRDGRPIAPRATATGDGGSGGYWIADLYGGSAGFGAPALDPPLRGFVVGLAADGAGGAWAVTLDGRVLARNGAPALGEAAAQLAPGEQAVGIAAAADEDGDGRADGYRVATDRGRLFAFGRAAALGDLAAVTLNAPIVGLARSASGRGIWLLGRDGGIFALGDAAFAGSLGAATLNAPIVGLAADPDGRGYWLVGRDGGVFAFEAGFRGSLGAVTLNQPVVGMVAWGDGYLLVARDGGVFAFADRPFRGSLGDRPPAAPVTAIAPAR